MKNHAYAIDFAASIEGRGVNDDDLGVLCERQQEEIAELEPVVTAAVLVTAAFRLKDERGLTAALRKLASAVDRLESSRSDD
jgi:hypothetical protein